MYQIIDLLSSVPADQWGVILTAFGLGGFQQVVKDIMQGKRDDKIPAGIHFAITLTLVAVSAVMDFLLSNPDNLSIIGVHSVEVFTAMTIAYRVIIKPLYTRFVKARAYDELMKPKGSGATTAPVSLEEIYSKGLDQTIEPIQTALQSSGAAAPSRVETDF